MTWAGLSILVGLVGLAFQVWPLGILILGGLGWLYFKS